MNLPLILKRQSHHDRLHQLLRSKVYTLTELVFLSVNTSYSFYCNVVTLKRRIVFTIHLPYYVVDNRTETLGQPHRPL